MPFENLVPVADAVVAHAPLFHKQSLGNTIRMHTSQEGMPSLDEVNVAIIGLRENRGMMDNLAEKPDFQSVRSAIYGLFAGNWHTVIADLGDIDSGNSLEDTYFAIKKITESLFKMDIIPIFLGGSQDLSYAIYRGYDKLDQMVNFVNVDNRFDLGDSSKPMSNTSYLGRIIVDKPYNLFNYANIGYQTFANSQEEIELVQKLYFDAYRLGEVVPDISLVEPVLRDADVVSIDLGGIESAALGHMHKNRPNGLNGREICAVARYAGLSDRVSSFGIFEYCQMSDSQTADALVAQIIWYFIEGVNYRVDELVPERRKGFLHYTVPVEDEVLSFYKSDRTGRWWIEIPFLQGLNNKLKRHTLLPCTYQDYVNACNQEIPERWFKARQKNEL
ncbi:formimidoylglutamase [Flavimarina sp. Hel_I_48]|uniref:formimidoylglutamase n=1 Tax=Flavimarina sp. Hel_I_48 TaxID=1392488 RepID=UPI0004DF0C1E|nr:formimidoylglutamase [Flavimarina sp. Hel_I_48]